MSTNVIKQTILGEPGSQTIKMVVRSNERGPKGEKGDPGIQGPQGIPGPRGYDGVIQYRAGTGINISDENIITATGDATAAWGGIQGNISNQVDLQDALKAKQDVMADFTGANGIVGGTSGKVPAPAATDNVNYLKGDGTWSTAIPPDGTISTAKLADSAVTTGKINDGAVTTGKIADSAVTTNKIVDASVTTDKIAGTAVTAAKLDFSTMPGNYSTTEIDTGFTWVDGKTIYKKTVNFGALPNNTTKAVAHSISNLGQVIRIDGIVNTGSSWQPLGYYDGGATRVAYAGNTNVNIYTTNNQSGSSAYITLYYTKSS